MHFNRIVVDDERTFRMDVDLYMRTGYGALNWFTVRWIQDENAPLGAERTQIDELWLDHDLGEDVSAMLLVDFLCLMGRKSTQYVGPIIHHIYVHSMNSVGAENIINRLGIYYDVTRMALPELVTQEEIDALDVVDRAHHDIGQGLDWKK